MATNADRGPPTAGAGQASVGPRLALVGTAVLAVPIAVACADQLTTPDAAALDMPPQLVVASRTAPSLQNRYIIRLRDEAVVRAVAAELTQGEGRALHFVYENTIKGFAATLPPGAVEGVRHHPLVRGVYADAIGGRAASVSSWGLDRIDQRDLPLDSSYQPVGNGGDGVTVYVLDSGIYSDHSQFGSRVVTGHPGAFDGYRDTTDVYYAEDCWKQDPGKEGVVEGHGTQVASVIGGATFGVAPWVDLVSVRIGPCVGLDSALVSVMIAGVEWVAANRQLPAVANFSAGILPGLPDSVKVAFEDAVAVLVDSGVPFIVAAGNEKDDACDHSPARSSDVITVAASMPGDTRWVEAVFGSNYGECVELFAPGHQITTAHVYAGGSLPDPYATDTTSGTSFSAPHVTGAAALYLAENTSASPAQVRAHLLNTASSGKLSGIGAGSPNLLLFVERVLDADIDGPTSITQNGDYDWAAVPDGGDFSYAYQWAHRTHHSWGYSNWVNMGTDSVLTLTVTYHDPDFQLRLAVSSGTQNDTTYQYVYGFCDPCPEFHDPPEDTLLWMPGRRDR